MSDAGGFAFGGLPGELSKRWPKTDDGEPVAAVFLTHCGSGDMEDELLINMLGAYGIPALALHPGDGDFGRVVLGMSGTGTDILVPETQYEDAKALMEAETDDDLQG